MKLPRYRDVKDLNLRVAKDELRLVRAILAPALSQFARLSGDQRGLGHLRSRSYSLLLTWARELVAQKYATADLHFAAHQVSSLIRKYPWDPQLVGTDPERAAKESFLRGEHRCKRVNQWFRTRRLPFRRRKADEWEKYFERMRGFIRYVIGDTPNLESIYAKADLTGGASIGVHGDATNLGRKLLAQSWSVTPTALPYVAAVLTHNFHFAERFAKRGLSVRSIHIAVEDVLGQAVLVNANKIAFVPKEATTHRSVATEPLGNGLVQKGVDVEMRDHLLRVNIDLSDQTLNQRLALHGSMSTGVDGFCTLDLRNASNSNALELVREVCPRDWFLLWDRLRSPCYSMDGVERRYSMICSMGNGFCFPLETLIFASACHAVNAGKPGVDWAVYGDDIVVRKQHYDDVVRLLNRIGFQVNKKKSFDSGPFRESCGANWYAGEDVTPFTLDFRLNSLQSLFKFLNLSRRNPRTTSFLDDGRRAILAYIPDNLLLWRPFKGAPDSGIDPPGIEYGQYWQRWRTQRVPIPGSNPVKHTKVQYQSWNWLELETRPVKDELGAPSWVVMAAAMRGHSSHAPFTFRRKTKTRLRVTSGSGDLISPDTTRADLFQHAASRFWAANGRRFRCPPKQLT